MDKKSRRSFNSVDEVFRVYIPNWNEDDDSDERASQKIVAEVLKAFDEALTEELAVEADTRPQKEARAKRTQFTVPVATKE